jgi:hypothetical protein
LLPNNLLDYINMRTITPIIVHIFRVHVSFGARDVRK